MARGTNVSNVNFSIPEGADPMGIGIPDLGKSSYDPIATIKRGWEKDREDRAIKNAERREEWKEQKKAIPTFESVNAKIAGILNQKAVKLGSYVDQQYKAGMFAPWAKSGEVDKDGKRTSTWQEMQRLESELASEGEAYNRLLPAYQKAEAIINDPTKNKQVDWDITKKRMDQFKNGSLEEMADVAPKLVAFKPDQINLQKEFMSILGDYITPDSEPVITKAFDPSTGKLLVRESTSKDQAILLRNTTSAIKDMLGRDDEYSNAMKNQYDMVKPKTKDGVPIDIVTYWVGEKIPDYGEKVKNTWVAPAGEGTGKQNANTRSMLGGNKKNADGIWEFSGAGTMEITREDPAVEGGIVKEKHASAATVEFSGIADKVFPATTSQNVYNQQTGEKMAADMVIHEQPVNAKLLAVASSDIDYDTPEGLHKKIKKGELIPEAIYNRESFPKSDMNWDWYVTSSSQVKKTEGEYEFDPTYNMTTVRPWKDIEAAFLQKVSGKHDVKGLAEAMDEMKQQKNNERSKNYNIFKGLTPKEKAVEIKTLKEKLF